MKYCKLPALLLAFALLFALAACKPSSETPSDGPSEEVTASAPSTEETSAGPDETFPAADEPDIRLAVLSGPTGVGAAKLLDGIDNHPAGLHASYEYTICSDNNDLAAGLTQGRIDIATMASNVAVKLYNQTGGDVKIIAAGTLGVLHILEGNGGNTIHSLEDLRGKTIWAAGQGANPEYILRYLLQESGLEAGTDVEVVFADAGEISAKLLSGDVQYAMLPVPAATAAIVKGEGQVREAIDVTEAWDELQSGSQLVMTAVVVRTEFAESYPELVDAFLADYEESINFVNNNIGAAAELVAGFKLTPTADIAKEAIPQCHLVFLSGYDMVDALSGYFHALWSIDHDSVGSVPSDRIYYIP